MSERSGKRIDRRRFLRHTGKAGAVFGAATLSPLGSWEEGKTAVHTLNSVTHSADPDELFRSGQFARAASGYAQLLEQNPNDAHALAQLGYIALLSNKFKDAERFLTKAIGLAPDDSAWKSRLADCFVRQDDFARAVPLLRDAGDEAGATQYDSLADTPYEIHGMENTHIPFQHIDPLPVIEASVNGLAPEPIFLDTGASSLGMSPKLAEEAGIREVATRDGGIGGRPVALHLGVVDSVHLGEIELRNFPVVWVDGHQSLAPHLADGTQPRGTLGTTVFYHFLTTMDYANRALVLRRKTSEQLEAFQAEAKGIGAESLPFLLAPDHFLFAQGSLNGHGQKLILVDTGGSGIGVSISVEMAEQVGFDLDYDNPREFNETAEAFPFIAGEVALGSVFRTGVPGIARPVPARRHEPRFGFSEAATITHEFFRPLSVTFDFANMKMYLSGNHPDAS